MYAFIKRKAEDITKKHLRQGRSLGKTESQWADFPKLALASTRLRERLPRHGCARSARCQTRDNRHGAWRGGRENQLNLISLRPLAGSPFTFHFMEGDVVSGAPLWSLACQQLLALRTLDLVARHRAACRQRCTARMFPERNWEHSCEI